jgi:ubiquitin-conjugating enzyme E2 A
MSDLKSISTDPPHGVSAAPLSDSSIFEWTATIVGPTDTPYEGGIFRMELSFGSEYPDKPPKVRFINRVFHPNIFVDGSLCLDLLQGAWSPAQTVESLLVSIRSLLADPNCSSPANPEASSLYQTNRKEYRRRVRACVDASLGC